MADAGLGSRGSRCLEFQVNQEKQPGIAGSICCFGLVRPHCLRSADLSHSSDGRLNRVLAVCLVNSMGENQWH